MDHRQFAQLCDLWCSGLSSTAHLSVHPGSSTVINQGVFFSSYCIDRHLQNMLSLWQDVFVRLVIPGAHEEKEHISCIHIVVISKNKVTLADSHSC